MSSIKGPDHAQEMDCAFEQLVECYQQPLLRMCCLYLRDAALAEDAVQETDWPLILLPVTCRKLFVLRRLWRMTRIGMSIPFPMTPLCRSRTM